MPSRKIEEQLEALRALQPSTDPAVAAGVLRKCLSGSVGFVVARAAKKAAELALRDLAPDLLSAFDRMFVDPVKTDPQCWAKSAVAEALVAFDYRGSELFLRGATYVQMEPVWGRSEDTAAALRGICLLALVACTEVPRLDLLRFYVDRLLDPDKTVRREVLRALEQMGGADCGLLLRLKARIGDKEPEVVGQALESLLHLEPELAIAFVGEYLESEIPDLRDEAALALGLARSPAAVALLVNAWKRSASAAILRALGLSRLPEAFDFLIEVIRSGGLRDRDAALEALKPSLDSGDLRARVTAALSG
ncbi:MAG TPA: HEAT repeat domain-containing protein [Bryobacteraceae bacterium]|nr:HEAT repeat domain-containing protein [Bryobacteraceae bacterium]